MLKFTRTKRSNDYKASKQANDDDKTRDKTATYVKNKSSHYVIVITLKTN